MQDSNAKKGKPKKWLIIVLVLIGLTVLCMIIGFISSLTPSGKATATANAEMTLNAKPTETSVPTETPVPTELPTLTADEEAEIYVNKLIPLMESVTAGLNDLAEYSNLMSDNPNLFTDDDFVSNFFATLDKIYEDMVAMSEVTPPAQYKQTHSYIVEAKDEFFLVRSLTKSGINNIDANDINAAGEHMQTFTEYISLATAALPQ